MNARICKITNCHGCDNMKDENIVSYFVLSRLPSSSNFHVVRLVFKRDLKTNKDKKWRLNCKLSPRDDMRFFQSKEEAILKYSVAGQSLYSFAGACDGAFFTLEEIDGAFTKIA